MSVRLTVAQAVVGFLANQWSERDGVERRLFAGCFGIFGHGNVAGIGQALLEAELEPKRYAETAVDGGGHVLPYWTARNEQGAVHTASAYARMSNRLQTLAVTSSIGPGATNMVTGASLATINRLPVLLLPGDVFATRASAPVLQELEDAANADVSVNDALRPVSAFFDRVWRPEQLPDALLGAMRVLTDPARTGAATIALPQDVQAEAYDWPEDLLDKRVWHVARALPEPAALDRALRALRASSRPLVVSGGGTIYSEATDALRAFAEATGTPVAETQAGKGSLPYDHPQSMGAVGSTGTTAANALAREADLVIGVGTRYSDFTTASRTAFANPGVRFINLNIAGFDAAKQSAITLQADAREGLDALRDGLVGWRAADEYSERATALAREWDQTVEAAYHLGHTPLPAQSEVIGAVNDVSGPRDVVVCAAGSMPGDLHKLWRIRDPKGYHVEYGYSCMGYEIAGGIGAKMACPDRNVFVMVGDGSYLMMSSELVTAVQERIEIVVVLVQNHGFASIGSLSQELGSQGYGTAYRYRDAHTGRLDGETLPVDLAANAESLGAHVLRATSIDGLGQALRTATEHRGGPVVVHVETDPQVLAPDSESWWDVPVPEVSSLESTTRARTTYDRHKTRQRMHL